MYPYFREGKFSSWAWIFLIIVVTACASAEEKMPAAEGSAAEPAEMSDIERMVATCQGRDVFGLTDSLPMEPKRICDFIVLGLAEAFAAMGRNHHSGMFCVPSDFSVDAYRERFLDGLSRPGLSKKRREDIMLTGVLSDGSAAADCNWNGEQTVGGLGEDCRWFKVVNAKNRDAAIQDLLVRSGSYSRTAIRRKAADAVSSCSGYIIGYLMAGLIADRIDRDPAFCVEEWRDEEKTVRRNDASTTKLVRIGTSLTAIKDDYPERTTEPAGDAIYKKMVEEFPCPNATAGS